MNRVLQYFLISLFVASLSSCTSKEKMVHTDTNTKEMTKQDSIRKAFGSNINAPAVGKSLFERNTAGVDVEITSLKRSGGELLMDVQIKRVAGVGASTPMPALNQQLSLSYPEEGADKNVVSSLKNGDSVYMIISYTTSITETKGMWSCEKILALDTQE